MRVLYHKERHSGMIAEHADSNWEVCHNLMEGFQIESL